VSLPFYPPRSFCFALAFEDSDVDASFQEINGLKTELTTEEVAEGGVNRYVHRLPVRTKYSNLIMKRGVVRTKSPLAEWLDTGFAGNFAATLVDPRTIVVMLLDMWRRPIVAWTLFGAYPVSWDHSSLNSTGNDLLIETIEISCNWVKRKTYAYNNEEMGLTDKMGLVKEAASAS
jgi:phage tail-like protein